MCNGAAKQVAVSSAVAPCKIKGRHSFGNVETGLEVCLSRFLIGLHGVA